MAGERAKGAYQLPRSSTISIETSVHQLMASGTQRDQVLLGISLGIAPE